MSTDNKCGGDGREDDERREKERRDVAEKMTETEKDVRRPGTKCSTCSTMPGAFDEDESSSAKKKCSRDHSHDAPEVIAPVEPPMSGFSFDGKDEEKKIDGKGTNSEGNLHVDVEVMMPVEPPMPGAVISHYTEHKNYVMAPKRREIVAKIAETEEKKVHRPGAFPKIPGAFGVGNTTQSKPGGNGILKDFPEVLPPVEPPMTEHVISDNATHGRCSPEALPPTGDVAIGISDQQMQSRSDTSQVPPDNDDVHALGAHAVPGRAFGELPRISPVGEASGESVPAEQRNAGVGEDNLVLPAFVPDENIVQAQRVVPLDTSSNGRESEKPPQKLSYPFHFDKKKCTLLTFLLAAVAVITLIVLGATGHLKEEKADSEPEPESVPFIQVGPDLHGLHKGDRFGRRVSLSADGTRLLVSTPALSIQQGDSAGGVIVYDINSAGSFIQVGQTIRGLPGDEANGILSGDGRHIAIGSPGYDASENNTNIGRADIFELKDAGNWTKVGGPIFGDAPRDKAGKSVALSFDGSIVAVSAPQRARAESGKGKVRAYRFEGNAWIQMGSDIVTEIRNDQFGWRVSASDNGMVIAIGARLSPANGPESGQVRVYRYMSEKNSWIQLGSAISGPAAGDNFGADVALSGDGSTVAACAWWHHGSTGTDSGQIRVYSYNNEGEWILTGTFDGDHELDSLAKMSLSRDGKRIATSKGEFDNEKVGYVRVYDYVGGTWRQVDKKLAGHDVHEDFGYATSLSADGSRMAVGAPAHTADPKRAGIVRVFDLPGRLS